MFSLTDIRLICLKFFCAIFEALKNCLTKLMRQSIFIGIFLLFSTAVLSQEVVMKNYRSVDGLPSNQTFHVMQDSKGFIWIGTDKGVSRFDGYEFKNYGTKEGLGGSTVLDIYEDKKGRIWFIPLNAKLSYYYKDSIHHFRHNDSLLKYLPKSPVPSKRSFHIDSANNIYLSVRPTGVYKVDSSGNIKHWETWPNYNNYIIDFDSVAITSNFFPNTDHFEILHHGKYDFSIKNPENFQPRRGLSFVNKAEKDLYLYSNTRSVFSLNRKGSSKIFKADHFIIDFIIGENKMPWIGLDKGGVKQFKTTDFKEESQHMLDGKSVSTIFKDKNGGYWFTTLENGVYYSSDLNTISFSEDQLGRNTNIKRIIKYQDKILAIAKNAAIIELSDNKKTKRFNISKVKLKLNESDFLDEIKILDKKVLLGTNLSFLIKDNSSAPFRKQHLRIKRTKKLTHGVKSICVTKKGNVYLGGALGFFEWESRQNNEIILRQKSRIRTSCIEEAADKSGVWIGSLYGLYKYDKKLDSTLYFGDKRTELKTRVLAIKTLTKSKLVLATKGEGLFIYNLNNNTLKQISKSNGLSSDFVTTLVIQDSTCIWAGTNYGVNRISIADSSTPIQHIDKADGLISNQINDLALLNSKLFISTDKGITIYNKKGRENTNNKLKVRIIETSASASDQGVKMVSYPHKTISFKYTPLVFYHAKDLSYKYRIAGLTEDWQYTTNNHVFFPYVPEGSYRFEISVKDKNGQWGHLTSMPFIIETPIWKTQWFIASGISLLIVIISAVIVLIISNRRLKARAKQEVIKYQQQALSNQMNPHFLFNSLNSIHRYLLENNSIFASKYLSKFARLMRLFLNNSERETITIEKEVESIKLYLELENLRMKNAFDFNVHIDKNLSSSATLMPTMLLQPIVENAVIHGIRYLQNANGLIELSFIKEGDFLKIVITDNGVGRDRASEIEHKNNQKSHGGSIVRKRIKLLNQLYQASITINYLDLHRADSQNKGTKVIIKNIPINLSKNDQDFNN